MQVIGKYYAVLWKGLEHHGFWYRGGPGTSPTLYLPIYIAGWTGGLLWLQAAMNNTAVNTRV